MKSSNQLFFPPRVIGFSLHVILVLLLLGGTGVMLYLAFQQPGGGLLIVYLLGSLALISLLPVAGYRGYALMRAGYSLERDGLRVRWGLRAEDIPLPEIIWVRSAEDLEIPLKIPGISVPGAILGSTTHEDIGQVEFMASSFRNLVIVASVNKTVVLSPEDPQDFIMKFQRAIEMGSLTPIPARSVIPAAYLQQVFADRFARVAIPASLGLTLLVMVVTSLLIPSRQSMSLGFDPSGNPQEAVPSIRALLLPVIAAFFFVFNMVAGLFFFRDPKSRPTAFVVWAAGVITPILFLAAILILFLTTS